jgi:hypothetical protein
MHSELPGLAMNSHFVSVGSSTAAAVPAVKPAVEAKTAKATAKMVRIFILNPPLGSVGGRAPLSSFERALILEHDAPEPAISGRRDHNKRTYTV